MCNDTKHKWNAHSTNIECCTANDKACEQTCTYDLWTVLCQSSDWDDVGRRPKYYHVCWKMWVRKWKMTTSPLRIEKWVATEAKGAKWWNERINYQNKCKLNEIGRIECEGERARNAANKPESNKRQRIQSNVNWKLCVVCVCNMQNAKIVFCTSCVHDWQVQNK